jgi:hypothetical protein
MHPVPETTGKSWEPPAGAELVDQNHWCALVRDEGGFSIWGIGPPAARLARVSSTDEEGLDLAWSEYRRLTRHTRIRRGGPKWLLVVTIAAAGVWVVSTAVVSLGFAFAASQTFGMPPGQGILVWAQAAEGVSYAVMIGLTVPLVAWFLEQRLSAR